MSEVQVTRMEEKLPSSSKQSDDINLVKGDKRRHSGHSQRGSCSQSCPHSQPGLQSPMTCRKCGKNWSHKQGPCPAKGRTCSKCGKPNHLAKMCLTPANRKQGIGQQRAIKVVKSESDSSSSNEEYLYSTSKDKSKIPTGCQNQQC